MNYRAKVTNKILREFSSLQYDLMRYCHHPNCSQSDICPQKHRRCKTKLDLDTAIAWRYAAKVINEIDSFIDILEYDISLLGHHEKKYQKLYDLLLKFEKLIERIQSTEFIPPHINFRLGEFVKIIDEPWAREVNQSRMGKWFFIDKNEIYEIKRFVTNGISISDEDNYLGEFFAYEILKRA